MSAFGEKRKEASRKGESGEEEKKKFKKEKYPLKFFFSLWKILIEIKNIA